MALQSHSSQRIADTKAAGVADLSDAQQIALQKDGTDCAILLASPDTHATEQHHSQLCLGEHLGIVARPAVLLEIFSGIARSCML